MFLGKLLHLIWKHLDIKIIRTSPYHPETKDLLEHWHHDLLVILKKDTHNKQVEFICSVCFVCISANLPHSHSVTVTLLFIYPNLPSYAFQQE